MTRIVVGMLLALAMAGPGEAQVRVDVGVNLPAPPPLIVIPEVRTVQYAPSVNANLFFYEGQYWVFSGGGWHVSVRIDGPWIVVAPAVVPRPILVVPVTYYRVPPGHWKQWHRKTPPHWGAEWGPEWAQKRGWKDRDDDRDDSPGKAEGRGKPEGHGKGGGHGRGKGN